MSTIGKFTGFFKNHKNLKEIEETVEACADMREVDNGIKSITDTVKDLYDERKFNAQFDIWKADQRKELLTTPIGDADLYKIFKEITKQQQEALQFLTSIQDKISDTIGITAGTCSRVLGNSMASLGKMTSRLSNSTGISMMIPKNITKKEFMTWYNNEKDPGAIKPQLSKEQNKCINFIMNKMNDTDKIKESDIEEIFDICLNLPPGPNQSKDAIKVKMKTFLLERRRRSGGKRSKKTQKGKKSKNPKNKTIKQ